MAGQLTRRLQLVTLLWELDNRVTGIVSSSELAISFYVRPKLNR
jgi:hypothetical protein